MTMCGSSEGLMTDFNSDYLDDPEIWNENVASRYDTPGIGWNCSAFNADAKSQIAVYVKR